MSIINAVSSIQHVKNKDGSYTAILPVNTTNEVVYDVEKGTTLREYLETLSDITNDGVSGIIDSNVTMLDDLGSIIQILSPFISGELRLNHVYRNDFKNSQDITLVHGTHESGKIYGDNVEFKLANPINKNISRFKLQLKTNRELVEGEKIVLLYSTMEDGSDITEFTSKYTNNEIVNINNDSNILFNVLVRINALTNIEVNEIIISHI